MRVASVIGALMLAVAARAEDVDEDTGRDLLFSDPAAELPDILLSESVVYVAEGESFYYTVSLTHQPGMREDKTIDLMSDEVRIYLTSSQEVYQQNDISSSVNKFVKYVGHRTQLIVNTGVHSVNGNNEKLRSHSTVTQLAGGSSYNHYPTPYVYVPYSTKTPSQNSPTATGRYKFVCPLCVHTAYCTQHATDIIASTNQAAGTGASATDAAFDGCLKVVSVYYAPIQDICSAAPTKYVAATNLPTACKETVTASNAGRTIANFDGVKNLITHTPLGGHAEPKTQDDRKDVKRKVRKAAGLAGTLATQETSGIEDIHDNAYNVGTYVPATQAWTSGQDAKAIHVKTTAIGPGGASSSHGMTVSHSSDYRIQVDGSHVLREIPKMEARCRYCERPGIKCEAKAEVYGAPCKRDIVNGGDQAPQRYNWLQTSYSTGNSWRGDLSSGAQLVFDSTNWNTPQTVKVTARQDDVYEPEVFKRGQDAYVHHYVVAQDKKLDHSYYENLDVNDLVVSVTDDDPAVVLQDFGRTLQATRTGLYPSEGFGYGGDTGSAPGRAFSSKGHDTMAGYATAGGNYKGLCTNSAMNAVQAAMNQQDCLWSCSGADASRSCTTTANKWLQGSDQLKLKLASEPMYDVTVYVQSGGFLADGTNAPAAATAFLPDDEDVIFQDVGQYQTCFKVSSGEIVATCASADALASGNKKHTYTAVHGCDPFGVFVRPESFIDQTSAKGTFSQQLLPHASICKNLTTMATCAHTDYAAAGCEWDDTGKVCKINVLPSKMMDLVCKKGPQDTIAAANEAGSGIPVPDITKCAAADGCEWFAGSGAHCHGADVGFDCNSFLTFSSTNWNTWQTLKVIAVDDDEDETDAGVTRGWGVETHKVGYLYTSNDWYYNSVGSVNIGDKNSAYKPTANGVLLGSAVTGGLSMFDTRFGHQIPRFPDTKLSNDADAKDCISSESALHANDYRQAEWQENPELTGYTSDAKASRTPLLSTFIMSVKASKTARCGGGAGHSLAYEGDFLTHQDLQTNDFVYVNSFTADGPKVDKLKVIAGSIPGCINISPTGADAITAAHAAGDVGMLTVKQRAVDPSGHVNWIRGKTDRPMLGCMVQKPAGRHTDASNKVCGGTTAEIAAANSPPAPSPQSSMVKTFDPATFEATGSGTLCGLNVYVQDDNLRRVLISRGKCEATEGRRYWYYGYNNHVNPTDTIQYVFYEGVRHTAPLTLAAKLPTALGLFRSTGATYGMLTTNTKTAPVDLWTTWGVKTAEAAITKPDAKMPMSMPTCPFTIRLMSSPAEGATVVVKVFEDPDLAALRDNELYFFEEPTFRAGILDDTNGECTMQFPGSVFFAKAHHGQDGDYANVATNYGSCYINNVPFVLPAANTLTSSYKGAVASKKHVQFQPRGGTSIDVHFTDEDWDVPRRITAIAYNDDVDEPLEQRSIYFQTSTCSGKHPRIGAGSGQAGSTRDCVADPLYDFARIHYESYDVSTFTRHASDAKKYTSVSAHGFTTSGATSFVHFYGQEYTVATRTSATVVILDREVQLPSGVTVATGSAGHPGMLAGGPANGMSVETKQCTLIGTEVWKCITVTIVDDDIADLVVLCGDNFDGFGGATGNTITDSTFIGSYDGASTKLAGPRKQWTDSTTDGLNHVVRSGANAEDGMAGGFAAATGYSFSGSKSGGLWLTTFNTAATSVNADIGSAIMLDKTRAAVKGLSLTNGEDGICSEISGTPTPAPQKGTVASPCQATIYSTGGDADGASATRPQYGPNKLTQDNGYFSVYTTTSSRKTTDQSTAHTQMVTGTLCPVTLAQGIDNCYPDTTDSWTGYDAYNDRYYKLLGQATFVSGGATFTIPTDTRVTLAAELKAGLTVYAAADLSASRFAATLTLHASTAASFASLKTTYTLTAAHGRTDTVNLYNFDLFQEKHVRGFKGTGPAITEIDDSYACTIHSLECKEFLTLTRTDSVTLTYAGASKTGDGTLGASKWITVNGEVVKIRASGHSHSSSAGQILLDTTTPLSSRTPNGAYKLYKDSVGKACVYGKYKLRLNSSPGTKKVRRQYLGTSTTVTEQEPVYIVVSPDATPQTTFFPTSVTFTHAGGLVDGKDTYRWDEPVEISVVPVDDSVDERRGVMIDFTAHSITQSHAFDEYWGYTTPYMAQAPQPVGVPTKLPTSDYPKTGTMCNLGSNPATATLTVAQAWMITGAVNPAPTPTPAPKLKFTTTVDMRTIVQAGDVVFIQRDATGTGTIRDPTRHLVGTGTTATVVVLDATTPYTGTITTGTSKATMTGYKNIAGKHFKSCSATGTVGSNAALGRIVGHTPYRHTIRTIHTMDNDFAGVLQESASVTQTLHAEGNFYTETAVAADAHALTVTEGGGFAWYTLQLRTDPRKVQRQMGTDPNKAIIFDVAGCGDVGLSGLYLAKPAGSPASGGAITVGSTVRGFEGADAGDWFADYSDRQRPVKCGCVEPESTYWVDVTVAQTMDVDLAVPPSCPATSPWGGGSSPSVAHPHTTATDSNGALKNDRTPPVSVIGAHPRFPFNTKGSDKPFNERDDRPGDMVGYLKTCGGWQHDATYRFDSSNWNVPQYVYLYAHDDKDAATTASNHVAVGGNELVDATKTYYTNEINHYVETEDVVDNILASAAPKVLQYNKHGGIYTYGNVQRFPFGVIRHGTPGSRTRKWGELDHVGFTTWGYSFYESLYPYGLWDAQTPRGYFDSTGCCSTAMGGKWGATESSHSASNKGTAGGASGLDTWGTPRGDTNHQVGNRFVSPAPAPAPATAWYPPASNGGVTCAFAGTFSAATPTFAQECRDEITGVGPASPTTVKGEPRPYKKVTGAFCAPYKRAGANAAHRWCAARHATDQQSKVYADQRLSGGMGGTSGQAGVNTGTGIAMKWPPLKVDVRVTDNDAVADQAPLAGGTSACRQTRLFQYADASSSTYTNKDGTGVHKTEWLVDYNCKNGDAGGLPGYPASAAIAGDAGVDGDDQCASGSGPYCQ